MLGNYPRLLCQSNVLRDKEKKGPVAFAKDIIHALGSSGGFLKGEISEALHTDWRSHSWGYYNWHWPS